jgi:hypothetical protein
LQSLFYARIQGASLRDPLVSSGTVISAIALLLSASSGSQRPHALPPSPKSIGPAGAAPAFAAEEATGSQAGPTVTHRRSLTGSSGPETARGWWVGVPWSAMGPVATSCDEAAEWRRPAEPLTDHFAERLRNKQTAA